MRIGFSFRNPMEKTKPKYMNFGIAKIKGNRTYTLDFERIFGEYGNDLKKARFFFIRGGVEQDLGNGWKGRGGIILPLQAKTSTLGNIRAKLPDPKFNATLGAGHTWKKTGTTLDFALYGDPGRSYIESDLKFGYVFTVRQRF